MTDAVFNVAVLIGPDSLVAGKYRKVSLPRGESMGASSGSDYPVFTTRFGRVGMMVCYDGFFPEVARELSNRRGGGHCMAGLGVQPSARVRPCLRESRLPSKQYV